MTEMELKGYTLGQKHQHHNRSVQEAVKSNITVNTKDFNTEDCDVIVLKNIDIASHQKNVEYILKVFTCEDMLYVSRAVRRSNWLINDQNYAHIINPNYLKTNMFPQMTSKAILKVIKHIRYNLKDEKRSEEFYSFEENPIDAVKWLPYCSSEFIQDKIANHVKHIEPNLLKRLCEKSITVLEIFIKNVSVLNKREALQRNMFLLSSNTDKYLDLVETVSDYAVPTFNQKATRFLMKNCSIRIISKFKKYYNSIHLPTFIKCMKPENIKDFLISQTQSIEPNNLHRFFNFKLLTIFIKSMPQEIRYEFVKFVFIDKKHLDPKENCLLTEKETKGMHMLCEITCNEFRYPEYIWYQFAPYDTAFQQITELIKTATSSNQKKSMLEVLLSSTQHDFVHEHNFLEYLRDKQKKTENSVKKHVIKKLLSNYNFLTYDQSTWIVLEDVLKSMNFYIESEDQEQKIIEAIILYKVIHDENVPNIVEKQFMFNSLSEYHKKLSTKGKDMIFMYLYDLITTKLTKCNVTNVTEFQAKITTLEQTLNLLKNFNKELATYPELIYIIRDLIKMKKDCSWNVSMANLFNISKTWRKLMFEESLELCPTELVLINALKHGPSLLEQNKDVVHSMLCNNKISLRHVLGKIRIYWSNSIAKNITGTYLQKLTMSGEHSATTRGLSILLTRKHLQDLITKFAPKEAKINWNTIGEIDLSVQQQFAKNMHNARPQPVPETILLFAKGDYLQYALPSILSIFYNLNSIASRKYIPSLLDAPVSLQKHGIRIAMSKMEIGELLRSFSDIWKSNKNATIRSVMFKNVHSLLCKEKDPKKIKAAWELMEMFIDNLTFQEDKSIYKLLFEVENIPLAVRGMFFMKCYNFLHKLINSGSEYEEYEHKFHTTFAAYSINVIEQLHPNFVPDIILEFIDKKFTKNRVDWSHECIVSLISTYLLDSTNEEIQMERYEKILLPVLKQCFASWSLVNNGECFVRYNLSLLLNKLRCGVKKCYIDRKNIPTRMFSIVQGELEHSLPASENYILLTKWNLSVLFTSILAACELTLNWEEACMKVAVEFGDKCNDYLKEDCDKFYPSIYMLFVKALKSMLYDFVADTAHFNIYRCMVHRENFIHGYLATIKLLSTYPCAENAEQKEEMRKLFINICEHPITEIRVHFYSKFQKTANEIEISVTEN